MEIPNWINKDNITDVEYFFNNSMRVECHLNDQGEFGYLIYPDYLSKGVLYFDNYLDVMRYIEEKRKEG